LFPCLAILVIVVPLVEVVGVTAFLVVAVVAVVAVVLGWAGRAGGSCGDNMGGWNNEVFMAVLLLAGIGRTVVKVGSLRPGA
jgi:hypothetical protein